MKLSAKSTALSFLAAMAVGAVYFSGCTVTSTTSSDTDGGTSSGSSGSSGTSSGGSDAGGGDDAATPQACADNKQTSKFDPPACQQCLEAKCCDKLTACFNQDPNAGDDAGANVDCNTYSDCIAKCNADNPTDDTALKACYDICDASTSPAIVTSYDILTACGGDSCAAECGGQ